MNVERFGNLRRLIQSSWRQYPFSVGGAAARRHTRASSSGEQGAIGLDRTGAGFRSPFAHAARLEQEAAPTDDSLFVVPQSSSSRLTAGYTMRCVTCGLMFGARELKGHQLLEHRDHVYRCSCRMQFRSSQDLRRHSRDAGHLISTVYRLPGEEEPFEIVPYADTDVGARARSRAEAEGDSREDENVEDQAPDVPYTTVVQIHPCELQPPCRCERVDLDLIVKVPDEQYPRCFECLKPLRGLGYTQTEILWMKVVSKLNWKEDPGMRLLPAPFEIGRYPARARCRARRGRSSTEGEAAAVKT